jgi:tetratricopeptide (TPR) repeat protein
MDLRLGLIAIIVAGMMSDASDARQKVAAGIGAASPGPAAESAALRARGLRHGYNLDYADAFAAFKAAIDADPADPEALRLVAATTWMQLLFQQGMVTVDDYLGRVRPDVPRKAPAPELDAIFRHYLQESLALGERRLRNDPNDADAHYQVGAAVACLASYTATVEGRVLAGFRAARRAYGEHARVLEIDPRRKDAGLVVGMYRYGVSTLPVPWRLLAHIAGFGGGHDLGLHMVEEAAAYPSDAQTGALFTLIVMYNREARYADAMRVIDRLQREYPRNRLLWLEAGSTALRAGRPTEARDAIEQGLVQLAADPRPRAFGEEARWRYYHGAALVALKEVAAAEHELHAALAGEAQEWVREEATRLLTEVHR